MEGERACFSVNIKYCCDILNESGMSFVEHELAGSKDICKTHGFRARNTKYKKWCK